METTNEITIHDTDFVAHIQQKMNSYNNQINYIKIYKKYQYYLFFAKDIFKISLNLTNYFINVKIYFRVII